jgi:hypothetical protein
LSKSEKIFREADKDVQNLVRKILALVRKNRASRGASMEKDITREVKKISK